MSWKSIKEHYQIEHIVSVDKETLDIMIGSPYIRDIIRFDTKGKFIKRYGDDHYSLNAHLKRYQKEMDSDIPKLVELINMTDSFSVSLPVYYYDYEEGRVIEDFCEEYAWPNCTHNGYLMYDNGFYKDKQFCITNAIENLKYREEAAKERIKELETQREDAVNRMINAQKQYLELEIELDKLQGKIIEI